MDELKLNLEPLLYWIEEREKIRKRKLGLIPKVLYDPTSKNPITAILDILTLDPILQKYRFTNVRRKDDRVSQWLLKNTLKLIEGFKGEVFDDGLAFTALCRWVNWPPTIKLLMNNWKIDQNGRILWESLIPVLESKEPRTLNGSTKVWTGAYMIRADRTKSKATYVIEEVIQRGFIPFIPELKEAAKTKSKHEVWSVLCKGYSWGSFMSGQVVDDWSWSSFLKDPIDQFTWAPQGPGSIRGLNRLLNLPLKTRHSEEQFCMYLQEARSKIISELGSEFEDLTLMDVQNQFCECDKYLRVKNGEGRPRSQYRPETAY